MDAISPIDVAPAEAATKGERTRAGIVEAASAHFIQKGYHGTSMRQIARQAGIALGGIYNHFESKQAIFAAVLEARHPYHRILPALAAAQGDTVDEFIRDAAGRVRAVAADAHLTLLPLVFIELVEFQGRHFATIVESVFPELLAFFQRFSERRGRLRPLPQPIVLRAFVGVLLAYTITEMVLKNTSMLQRLEYDWFGGMVDIYLHGIVAPDADLASLTDGSPS